MVKKRVVFTAVGLCLLLLALSPTVNADIVKFGLNFLISGDQPNGTPPWLSAEFTDSGTDQVLLTMGAGGLTVGNQFVSNWFFNLNYSTTPLLFKYLPNPDTVVNGPEALSGITFVPIGSQVPSSFNLQFSFLTTADDSFLFNAGEFVTYLISGPGLTASLFDFENEDGYLTMAQVGGINPGEGSGLIGQKSDQQPVPEPATMLLLGIGVIGVAFFDRKKFLVTV